MRRLTYCITFTYPLILFFRMLQKLRRNSSRPKTHLIALPGWANRIMLKSVHLEARLLRHCNLPFGVTLLAIAQKTDS